MSQHVRRYFEALGGRGMPLIDLAERLACEERRPSQEDVRALAEDLRLPATAVRGVLGYYAELAAPAQARRVCHGTSCLLARRPRTEGGNGTARLPVYCLGFCDRSPASLVPGEGLLLAGTSSPDPNPPPPPVRCLAPEPIVTRHLPPAADDDRSRLDAARRAGVYATWEQARERPAEELLETLEASGLRGRGGAGFPTGVKWRTAARAPAPDGRLIIANGDEGDPGSFVDRLLMEHDPHSILEALLLASRAVGAEAGVVFVRAEYPRARRVLERAVEEATEDRLLGPDSPSGFTVEIFPALGSYVCGEETALIAALEGDRGEVRLRPPYPAEKGFSGRPTVVDNVETLVQIPWIFERGAEAFRALGTDESCGTKALCFNRGFARPGVVEVEMGTPLEHAIDEAGGAAQGPLAAVLLGGPMGSLVAPEDWDVPVCFAATAARGIQLGHGGLVAIPEDFDPDSLLVHLLEFMAHESCGRCVPCRSGSRRALAMAREGIGRLGSQRRRSFEVLLDTMAAASLCAFGQMAPGPMRTLMERFGHRLHGRGLGNGAGATRSFPVPAMETRPRGDTEPEKAPPGEAAPRTAARVDGGEAPPREDRP